ncbi:EXTL2, alpha-1,4-N-acetylhexosaminyltransferase [Opisthorchis viverrini]|uniref:EXTL2, alpha-1,4-N-acetylhexosaminyltransferase n=1 Tax=Opisthorchis viverrini TaxID=6198 RepID=A0A1S8WL93_OPIVI|nr:EXTL2, alpha-1,4-N-acetylhexosaminyltransferase [Opisthorchis viverrini]
MNSSPIICDRRPSVRMLRNSYQWALLLATSICTSILLSNIITLCFYLFAHYDFILLTGSPRQAVSSDSSEAGHSFLSLNDWVMLVNQSYGSSAAMGDEAQYLSDSLPCTMETCFDYARCASDFKVYVYSAPPGQPPVSSTYGKILAALRRYRFLTTNPYEACIFIPSLDTLDRDPLSPGFGVQTDQQLNRLPYWNELPRLKTAEQIEVEADDPQRKTVTPGRNHLIFNLYAGTWPGYHEDEYRLSLGQAILAKASFSTTKIRHTFDISLPLIHPQHPEKISLEASGHDASYHTVHQRTKVRRPILLSFKGKRYVSGIGSASRNTLFHLHNGDDVIMVTTCRHGTDWIRYADKRCPVDMTIYDQYDYNELMHNSTFCLVPRGRRLGSYRFLEALEASCIPVMLSNDWELPFSEVIDWSKAVIWADEHLPLTLSLMLRRIPDYRIVQLRQQITFLYSTYFQSVESIVFTTLEIIRDRLAMRRRSYTIWNSPPGGLVLSQKYSFDECDVPLAHLPEHCQQPLLMVVYRKPMSPPLMYLTALVTAGFSMLLPISKTLCHIYPERLSTFASSTFTSESLRKVIVVWLCNSSVPSPTYFTQYFNVEVEVVVEDEFRAALHESEQPSVEVRFQPFAAEIPTLAVFSFGLNMRLSREQLEFAFATWKEFPHRLIGFRVGSHHWNVSTRLWNYDGFDRGPERFYSIVSLDVAFYHRHYHYLYWQMLDHETHKVVNTFTDCEDILLNLLIGHLTHMPPIKLLSQRETHALDWPHHAKVVTEDLVQRSACLQAFAEQFAVLFGPASSDLEIDPSVVQTNTAAQRLYLPLYKSSLLYV